MIDAAIARAVAFLEAAQLPGGEIPVLASIDPELREGAAPDPSVFPTALAAHALSFCPEAAPICARTHDFLLGQMDGNGLWKHWTRAHPHAASLPPDLDDTSCASAVLAAAGRAFPDNRALILANRDGRGRFFTWIVPRPRPTARPHMRLTLGMLRRLPSLVLFFRLTSADPYDVDAAVNASTLFYLGDFPGREQTAGWLLEVLRRGEERECDKWYESPFVVRYLFARALLGVPEAEALLVARTRGDVAASALDHAFAASTLMACGADASEHVEALLAVQAADGSWPRAAIYHGGRRRRRQGGFELPHPDTPRWGSEALTTAFAVEALARARTSHRT
jgi:hypothetical protein